MTQWLLSTRGQLRWAVLTALLVFSAYVLCLEAPFHFDAKKALLTTAALHHPGDFEAIINFDPYLPRPLFHFSLALDWRLWNGHPFGFHLVNLLWHIAAVFLLWRVLKKLLSDTESKTELAAGAALLFGLHPALTESVTYTWGRSGVMSAALLLFSLLLYLHARARDRIRLSYYFLSILTFSAALLAKETAAVLPAFLVAVESPHWEKRKFLKPFGRIAPYFVIVVLVLVWRAVVYGRIAFGLEGSYSAHIARQICVAAAYLRLLAWPVGLSIVHHVPDACSAWRVAISAMLLAAIVTGATVHARRAPVLWFAGVFFFVGIAPFFFIPLKDRMVERNLYLPAMGFALLLSAGIEAAGAQWRRALFITLAACFLVGTAARNRAWLSEHSIWMDAARKAALDARPRAQLGALALAEGDTDAARRYLESALALDPKNAEAHNNLGVIYLQRGDTVRAGYEFASAINSNNDHVQAHLNYIRTLDKQGDRGRAEILLEKIVKRWPSLVDAKLMLGDAYRLESRLEDALRLFRAAWRLDHENSKIALGIGLTYFQGGENAKALEWLMKSVRLDPTNPKSHRALGMLFFAERDFAAAAKEYEKAVRRSTRPDPDILADWGLALMRAGHVPEARSAFRREMDLRPSDPRPYLRLALLEEKGENIGKARTLYLKARELDKTGRFRRDIKAGLERLEAKKSRGK